MRLPCLLALTQLVACALPPAHDAEVALGTLAQGAQLALSAADKAVLEAPDGSWRYVEFPDTQCRDGSKAGLLVRRNAHSSKLLVFFEGGGICFDAQTCAYNDANVQYQVQTQFPTLDGLLNFDNPANPVRDWNVVYVPYCTGDLHAGTRRNVQVAGVGVQQFVGRHNVLRFLRPLARLTKAPTDVVLAGVSAGGFGAALNLVPIQDAFDDAFGKKKAPKVRLVNDSGAFVDASSLAVCLQQAWRATFGWDDSFLAEWPDAKHHAHGEFMAPYARWLAQRYRDRPNGFLETTEDEVITAFYGIGRDDCTGVLFETPIAGDAFRASLLRLRSSLSGTSTATFYLPGSAHTFLEYADFYQVSAAGSSLVGWFGAIARGQVPGDVGP